MTTTYQTEQLKDGTYKVSEVKEYHFTPQELLGNAIITHVGGNGRFKFMLDNKEYYTTFTKGICTDIYNHGINKLTDNYYVYRSVQFNINIYESGVWSQLYCSNQSTEYWKPI